MKKIACLLILIACFVFWGCDFFMAPPSGDSEKTATVRIALPSGNAARGVGLSDSKEKTSHFDVVLKNSGSPLFYRASASGEENSNNVIELNLPEGTYDALIFGGHKNAAGIRYLLATAYKPGVFVKAGSTTTIQLTLKAVELSLYSPPLVEAGGSVSVTVKGNLPDPFYVSAAKPDFLDCRFLLSGQLVKQSAGLMECENPVSGTIPFSVTEAFSIPETFLPGVHDLSADILIYPFGSSEAGGLWYLSHYDAENAGNEMNAYFAASLNVKTNKQPPTEWIAIPAGTGSGTTQFTTDKHIVGIAYGDGKFVAVQNEGTSTAYSPDGITWTAGGNAGFNTRNIGYGNGKFVIVGFFGKRGYSDDGISWTTAGDSAIPNSSGVFGIVYGGGKFVAVGDSGKIAYSDDGMSWTAVAQSNLTNFGGVITYGNNMFIAGARDAPFVYSPDGINWTALAESPLGTEYLSALVYGGDKFIAAGVNGSMMYSPDGMSWIAIADSTFAGNEIRSICYHNGLFVAGGNSGKMAYSFDGLLWTAVADSKFGATDIFRITYGDNKFVVVGDTGKMSYCVLE